MWIRHPRTKEPDTMLTVAVAGFIFSMMFSTAALVAAWVLGSADFLKYLAGINAAILTPSLAAYTARKHTDSKKVENKGETK